MKKIATTAKTYQLVLDGTGAWIESTGRSVSPNTQSATKEGRAVALGGITSAVTGRRE
ncbi:hypothetical protein FHS27_006590 [Rhodopirellula rubra]|uniref:Uncharacterized protein n=1 Tax=Aporhodopirellula rubra TaxID=980271 RepID=A0A7W5H8J0_9BACT|nr:hypothetical protein [Aporhodopirellula rubra]